MSARRVVTPVVGGWRIVDEVDAYEGDHEWCPRYEAVDGITDTVYSTFEGAQKAIDDETRHTGDAQPDLTGRSWALRAVGHLTEPTP